ncbi:hypothetical protein HKD37_15G043720 [Glycine soja]
MNEDQWMYESIMSEEVDMDYQNEEACGVNEPHVDCSDAFNTSQVFDSREDVLRWARFVAHENGFVAMIIRSDTNTGSRGRTSFMLIGCERSGEYRDTGTRKCRCPFKIRGKPVVGGQGWMVKLMCGIHNHELAKSLVGHSYVGRLTKVEKTLIIDMTKSMVKPRNILLTLKEHNVNSCTTIKQIYNARRTFRSSIRGSDTEMQHLTKLLERDQYIHWHRIKDEEIVRDIFWCHLDAVNTHGLHCACELSKYVFGCIPLDSIHMFWRRLSFSDQGLSEPEVSIKEEIETISKRFEELDVCGKFTLKTKLWEIAYPDQNSMCPPPAKVNTKETDEQKPKVNKGQSILLGPFMHDFIHNIVDVKAYGNCGYRSVADLLGMGEDSWSLVRNHLLKELGKFSEDYIKLFGGTKRFEELRMSLLVDGLIKVTTDKWIDITDMEYVIASRSQLLSDSSVHRIICIGHVYGNHFVEVKQRPTPYISRMQHYKSFVMFKRDYNTQQSFTDTGNHLHFQCMQLKIDDDVHTMLMSNHQFLCVGPIELVCTIGRTPDGILNLLEATVTPTYDALLYNNGRWNMPRQNEFVGYSFTGKNPKKFDIPSRCTMDELKDLIKQVVPHGIPPYGIHETQTVRRLFFRQPSHHEYSDKIIKFEIIKLKINDDVLKVLVQSNYWKKFWPIEILAIFSKHVMEMEDELSL